jgi:hypothetical protein
VAATHSQSSTVAADDDALDIDYLLEVAAGASNR